MSETNAVSDIERAEHVGTGNKTGLKRTGIFGDYNDTWVSIKANSDGKLLVDVSDGFDPDDIIANQLSQLMVRIATNSSDDSITYVGRAPIGSATSSGVWQITKYDESVSEVSKFAGDGKYNQIFNSRESLSYE